MPWGLLTTAYIPSRLVSLILLVTSNRELLRLLLHMDLGSAMHEYFVHEYLIFGSKYLTKVDIKDEPF